MSFNRRTSVCVSVYASGILLLLCCLCLMRCLSQNKSAGSELIWSRWEMLKTNASKPTLDQQFLRVFYFESKATRFATLKWKWTKFVLLNVIYSQGVTRLLKIAQWRVYFFIFLELSLRMKIQFWTITTETYNQQSKQWIYCIHILFLWNV